MRYHLPAPSCAYMVIFCMSFLQTIRPTTLQQKEDLMHTPSKIKVSAYTHRFYLTWWWLADQLFLITENSCSVVVPSMQETTVRPPRESHGAESGITYKHMCELKPVYGQQLIPLYERLSRPDLLELCKDLHTTNANESPKHLPTTPPPPQLLETGVAMSVLKFNYGSRGSGLN